MKEKREECEEFYKLREIASQKKCNITEKQKQQLRPKTKA
jgi:hypothetical protein